jgi:hypothetical protein
MPNQAAWWCSALLIFSLDRQYLIVRGLFRIKGSKGYGDTGLFTLTIAKPSFREPQECHLLPLLL